MGAEGVEVQVYCTEMWIEVRKAMHVLLVIHLEMASFIHIQNNHHNTP
jgi:hypothetical protein